MFWQALTRHGVCRKACRCLEGCAGAIHNDDGHQLGDLAPTLPAVKLQEIIRAHDPDEAHAPTAAFEIAQAIERVACPDGAFETGDSDCAFRHQPAGGHHAVLLCRKVAGVLERIARRHNPPDPIQAKTLECC